MEKYADKTEDTLVTFHIGRGGSFYNGGHLSYVDQDKDIDSYVYDLFVAFENQQEIFDKIGDRENLKSLFQAAIDGDIQAFEKIEKITGLLFGKQIYIDLNGNSVGLDLDNDGTGRINQDGQYDTTYVRRLKDCTVQEFELIYNSSNYVSIDVLDYCKSALLEKNLISNSPK